MKHIKLFEQFITEAEKAKGDRGPLKGKAVETGIKNKSKESGVPLALLRIIMRRGMDAWNSGHHPGMTQEGWGYARVNAFLEKGKGTWGGADKDVAKEVRDGGHDKSYHLNQRKINMKFVQKFEEWNEVSPELTAHIAEGLDLTNSLFRLGSDAYCKLFEEVKQYWDKGNIVLNGPSGWMAKNLEVGTAAVYTPRGGNTKKVKLDSPERGGTKKFIVYRNSGRTDKEGNIIAKKLEWGDPNLSVKNDDPGKAASFWARHQCDQKEKMDPTKAGFWACYGPTLFGKQLGIKSDQPW